MMAYATHFHTHTLILPAKKNEHEQVWLWEI